MEFIEKIAPIIQKKAFALGYNYPSAIIAQACLESNYGKSKLSSKYHNYFGMKCGSYWKGSSVNMDTKEEYLPGVITNISANFRTYSSMEAGVDGYFDFISTKRYANLKTALNPRHYIELIKIDGYATSNSYTYNVYAIIKKYNLTIYDNPNDVKEFDPDLIHTMALNAIKGAYGNGETRKLMLGEYYSAVQKEVNRILKG